MPGYWIEIHALESARAEGQRVRAWHAGKWKPWPFKWPGSATLQPETPQWESGSMLAAGLPKPIVPHISGAHFKRTKEWKQSLW